jgi:hypothetical protein
VREVSWDAGHAQRQAPRGSVRRCKAQASEWLMRRRAGGGGAEAGAAPAAADAWGAKRGSKCRKGKKID